MVDVWRCGVLIAREEEGGGNERRESPFSSKFLRGRWLADVGLIEI